METDQGKHSQNKRRERALYIESQYDDKQSTEDEETSGHNVSNDHNHSDSSSKSSNYKLPRPKPKKGKKSMFEEDIIDGFAIMSFKTLDDLEIVTKQNESAINDENLQFGDGINGKDPQLIFDKEHTIKQPKRSKKNSSHDSSAITQNGECSNGSSSSRTNHCQAKDGTNGEVNGSKSHLPAAYAKSHKNKQAETEHRPFKIFRTVSKDLISDCEVENGDDKASESGSDLNSGISNGSILSQVL